ncbi:MAG: CocE/NonD family hydrolase [Bacillota bacterium]
MAESLFDVDVPCSKPEHEVRVDFDVRVPMRDGITLSADVYRPSSAGRFPAILLRTPYLKTSKEAFELATYFATRGYSVVWMDVRGRGDSEGAFVPYRNDGPDGHDAIEWCAAQPWCDGNVGTMGGSYLGRIQWLTAVLRPPHLRCMVVLVTPSDPFVEMPIGTEGPMHVCWRHMTSGRVLQNAESIDWMKIYEHLPLATMDEKLGRHMPDWREALAHQTLDDYWRPLCYQNRFHEVDVPVLHISGWYDDEQIGTPLNFIGMTRHGRTEAARRSQKLLMGPWAHRVNTTTKLGEVDFGPSAVIDLRKYQLRWFDYWLKGIDSRIMDEPPVRIFVMGANRWRDEHEWPLERTRWTRYYLHSAGRANSRFGDGLLSTDLPGDEPPDSYDYDPARPVPFITEPTSSQIGGPDDYSAVERRDDVLVYTTPPLAEDVEVTGPIRVELYASSSAVDTDFTAKLLDVWPNGFAQRLCDGIVRCRYREGMDRVVWMEPGRIYPLTIDLWNTSQVFKKGHAIRLEISSSAFPKYDRNLNTGGDLAAETRMVVAHQTVYHDREHPSCVILPIIPAAIPR